MLSGNGVRIASKVGVYPVRRLKDLRDLKACSGASIIENTKEHRSYLVVAF